MLAALQRATGVGPLQRPGGQLAGQPLRVAEEGEKMDPRQAFAAGLEAVQRAPGADPPQPGGACHRGRHILLERGVHENRVGINRREALPRAAVACRESMTSKPGDLTSQVGLSMAAAPLLRFEVRRLVLAAEALGKGAVSTLRGVLEENPRMNWAHRTLGDVPCRLGEAAILAGRDPSARWPGPGITWSRPGPSSSTTSTPGSSWPRGDSACWSWNLPAARGEPAGGRVAAALEVLNQGWGTCRGWRTATGSNWLAPGGVVRGVAAELPPRGMRR